MHLPILADPAAWSKSGQDPEETGTSPGSHTGFAAILSGPENGDVGEVLARAPTLASALGALLRSASHRLVLLDKRMTDVGFGVHREGAEVCVVGLFASWPRVVTR